MATLIDGSERALFVVSELRSLEAQLRTVVYDGRDDEIAIELGDGYIIDPRSYAIFKASPARILAAKIYNHWHKLAMPVRGASPQEDDERFEKYGPADTEIHDVLGIMIPEIFPKTNTYMVSKALAEEFGQLELPL